MVMTENKQWARDHFPEEQNPRDGNHESEPRKGNGQAFESSVKWIDTSRWDSEPCPARQWAVKDRIPLRQVTLLSGEGSIGKSIVEMMCAVAHVTAKDWLKSLPEPGGAFYIGCEDDEAELRIRLTAIVRHYGTTFDELRDGGFRFLSLVGEDAILGAPDRNNIIKPTALFNRLYEQAGDLKPKHIGIDTSADVFAGNESDRGQVRQFIGLLRRLAIAADGAVVLLSHPSLTGISSGTGISGSTAWHNSVRARMYMTAPKLEPGDQPDTNLRELQFKKSNYGPVSSSIVLRYQNGLFLPQAGVSSIEKAAQDATADDVFLTLLKRFAASNRNVSDKASSNYAPALFAHEDEARRAGINSKVLADAMRRLFQANRIWNEPCGKPSRPAFRLAVK
jgi:RecA-family ATPase